MITYVYGDLIYSPARVLINPVNTVGAMGTGLANDFKRFYPAMFEQYRVLCQTDKFEVGNLFLYRTAHKWIVNFPTKKHWRAGAKLEYIEAGLQKFAAQYAELNITAVSFPLLGTGSGGLQPAEVRPLMEAYLGVLPIMVYIHLYKQDDPFETEGRNLRTMRAWLNAQPQVVTFDEFWREIAAAVKKYPELKRLDTGETFQVNATPRKGAQRISLKIMQGDHKPIFIPETQLQDLWQYFQRAGYALPQNFPGGLESYAPFLVALLAKIPMLRPVYLTPAGGEKVIGLHYIAPIDHKAAPRQVSLK
jgi:O-acetyl-ADP-ribose deacetylase (regulator of RNase III)